MRINPLLQFLELGNVGRYFYCCLHHRPSLLLGGFCQYQMELPFQSLQVFFQWRDCRYIPSKGKRIVISERASISSVQWISVVYIYMYVCTYV